MTSGTRCRCNVKGDLGFAELSVTASYFDRKINYELDDTNYAQWRTAYYGGYPAYYALYRHRHADSVTFNYQKQKRWAYEVRLTSQGDSSFSGWRARSTRTSTTGGITALLTPGTDETRRPGQAAQMPRSARTWATTSRVRCPTQTLLLNKYSTRR